MAFPILGEDTTVNLFARGTDTALDETMIATLLGPISTSFNSFANLSWIATTYLIGMSADWCPFVSLALTGVGFGASWVTVLMGILSSIDDEQQATIQSAGYAVRSLGMTVGLTVATGVFQQLLKSAPTLRFESQPGTNLLVPSLRSDLIAIQGLDPALRIAARDANMEALHAVFWITTAESVTAGVASMMMKESFTPGSLKG